MDKCGVCGGDGTSCCPGGEEGDCCVDYCDIPDPYWDYVLLPVTLQDIIEKLRFTRELLDWIAYHYPTVEEAGEAEGDLHLGRMAEFNRLFLEECLEDFCEASAGLGGGLREDATELPAIA